MAVGAPRESRWPPTGFRGARQRPCRFARAAGEPDGHAY